MHAFWYCRSPAGEFSIRYINSYWQALHQSELLSRHASPQAALENLVCCHAFRFAGREQILELPRSLQDWHFSAGGREKGNKEAAPDIVALYESLMADLSAKAKAA